MVGAAGGGKGSGGSGRGGRGRRLSRAAVGTPSVKGVTPIYN